MTEPRGLLSHMESVGDVTPRVYLVGWPRDTSQLLCARPSSFEKSLFGPQPPPNDFLSQRAWPSRLTQAGRQAGRQASPANVARSNSYRTRQSIFGDVIIFRRLTRVRARAAGRHGCAPLAPSKSTRDPPRPLGWFARRCEFATSSCRHAAGNTNNKLGSLS